MDLYVRSAAAACGGPRSLHERAALRARGHRHLRRRRACARAGDHCGARPGERRVLSAAHGADGHVRAHVSPGDGLHGRDVQPSPHVFHGIRCRVRRSVQHGRRDARAVSFRPRPHSLGRLRRRVLRRRFASISRSSSAPISGIVSPRAGCSSADVWPRPRLRYTFSPLILVRFGPNVDILEQRTGLVRRRDGWRHADTRPPGRSVLGFSWSIRVTRWAPRRAALRSAWATCRCSSRVRRETSCFSASAPESRRAPRSAIRCERVTAVDLLPEVIDVLPWFGDFNARLRGDPRASLHASDAAALHRRERRHIRCDRRRPLSSQPRRHGGAVYAGTFPRDPQPAAPRRSVRAMAANLPDAGRRLEDDRQDVSRRVSRRAQRDGQLQRARRIRSDRMRAWARRSARSEHRAGAAAPRRSQRPRGGVRRRARRPRQLHA